MGAVIDDVARIDQEEEPVVPGRQAVDRVHQGGPIAAKERTLISKGGELESGGSRRAKGREPRFERDVRERLDRVP